MSDRLVDVDQWFLKHQRVRTNRLVDVDQWLLIRQRVKNVQILLSFIKFVSGNFAKKRVI